VLSEEPTALSVYRGDASDVFESLDPSDSVILEKFFRIRPGLRPSEPSSDMFSAVEVDRYGGETLSTSTASPYHALSAAAEAAK